MIEESKAAAAAVMESVKDPFRYPWITYLWVMVWAIAGGIVNFIGKVKAGISRSFNVAELLGEMFISGVVGVITFWLCEYANVPPLLSAVFIAISGHMGSRVLFKFERVIERYVEVRTGIPLAQDSEGNVGPVNDRARGE